MVVNMVKNIRILVLNSSSEELELIRGSLGGEESGYQITGVSGVSEFGDLLDSGPWDMVLSEIKVDGYENLQVIDEVKKINPGVPVVILTGQGSEEIAAESMRRGAADYIIRSPAGLSNLPERLRQVMDITDAGSPPGGSEIFLNKLVRNSIEMLVILDENGKELFVSDSVERVTGFSPQELHGSSCFNYLHPDDLERITHLFKDLVGRPGASNRGEYRHRKQSGGWIHLEAVATNFLNDPNIRGIVLNVRDITERKEREEQLLNSWKTLDKLVRNSNDLLIIMDEKGNELYVSESVEKITGYSAEEMLGKCCFDYFHPDDVSRIAETFNRGINNPGEPQRVEYRRRTKDGKWIELEAIGTSYLDDPDISAIVVNARDITDRRRAEESQREQGEILDKLVRNSSDTLAIVDQDGREKYVSESIEQLTGFRPDEVLNTICFDHFHPDDAARVREAAEKLINNPDDIQRVEYRRRTKNGGWIYLEGICTNHLEDPDIRGIVVNARDITDRKNFEKRLKGRTERYRRLVSLLPEAVWEADLEGRISFLNKRGLELLGYSKEDIEAGLNGFDFFTMPGRQKCIERTMRVIEGGETGIAEYEMRRKDGSTFPALVHSDLVRMEGKPGYFIGIGIDITESKKADLELRQLAAAIEQAREAVVITDAEGEITYVNPSYEMITGYSRNEVLGQNPSILKSGEHSSVFYRSMWKVLTAGKTWQGRFVNKRKNGTLYSEQATISPVFDEKGDLTNYVAVKRDITEELKNAREKVKLQQQYNQAQKMETVGLLAGGIAHDLNNLLTPILGYGEMINEDSAGSKSSKAYAEIIVRAGNRARDIVSQLLAFSRQQAMDMEPVDMNQLIAGFEDRIKQIIPGNVSVNYNFSEDLPMVLGDPIHLEQVVTNLLENARDAMPDGGSLNIETSTTELNDDFATIGESLESGLYATLVISDTGLGMDDQTLSQIFEPFFSTKPRDKGSGLGLATAYGIIRQHGGDIRVYSQPLQGTTFRILLPVTEFSFDSQNPSVKSARNLGGNELILLVEDDEQVREMSISVLERRGYKVLKAETGEDAIEILRNETPSVDLLLTDVVMPGINGRELYDLIAPTQPDMKVIYMSGYAGEVLSSKGIIGEGINFIQKPFSVQSLTKKIRKVLDQKLMGEE